MRKISRSQEDKIERVPYDCGVSGYPILKSSMSHGILCKLLDGRQENCYGLLAGDVGMSF